MRIEWHINAQDITRVRNFYEQHKDDNFVRKRIERNQSGERPPISKGLFWERMTGCLLTTQQRSGPNSPISRFMSRPFALDYEVCLNQSDLAEFARAKMSAFGGIRRSTIIGEQLAANRSFLESGGWQKVFDCLDELRDRPTREMERRAADFIDDNLVGFGPKQSRNLLQWLGLTRFEVPIDSRITRWLTEFGFPMQLNAACLADRDYYEFVSDGINELCKACDILPCILDAAIFASYDKGRWTEDDVNW
jgi:hypothetical protein